MSHSHSLARFLRKCSRFLDVSHYSQRIIIRNWIISYFSGIRSRKPFIKKNKRVPNLHETFIPKQFIRKASPRSFPGTRVAGNTEIHRFSTSSPPRVELKFQNFGRIALEFRLVFHNGTNSQRERERESSHRVARLSSRGGRVIDSNPPSKLSSRPHSPSNPLPYSSSLVAMLLASNQRQPDRLSLSLYIANRTKTLADHCPLKWIPGRNSRFPLEPTECPPPPPPCSARYHLSSG